MCESNEFSLISQTNWTLSGKKREMFETEKYSQQTKHSIQLDDIIHENDLHYISWDDLIVNEDDFILGRGSFSVVFKAKFCPRNAELPSPTSETTIESLSSEISSNGSIDVAIKIPNPSSASDFDHYNKKSLNEFKMHQEAFTSSLYHDGMLKPYGIVKGRLPPQVASALYLSETNDRSKFVGIVTALGGVSLDAHLADARKIIRPDEKLKILQSFARVLTELHAIGS